MSKLAFIMALLAMAPSFAAFTPAVLISLIALLLTSYPAYTGALRISALTFLAATIAVAGSPIFTLSSMRESPVLGLVLGIPYMLFLLAFGLGLRRRWLLKQSKHAANSA